MYSFDHDVNSTSIMHKFQLYANTILSSNFFLNSLIIFFSVVNIFYMIKIHLYV
jgi:hypothetical protein